MILAANFGYLFAFILGTYHNIFAISQFIILLAVLFEIALFFMPESPIFLIRKGKIAVSVLNARSINSETLIKCFHSFKMAEKSMRFYKNLRKIDEHNVLLELEMQKIQTTLINGQVNGQSSTSIESGGFTSKISCKAILIGVVLIVLNTYNGNITLSNYTKLIFDETGSNLSTDLSAIITAIIQIVGVFVATQLVDRLGRKVLSLSTSKHMHSNLFYLFRFYHFSC